MPISAFVMLFAIDHEWNASSGPASAAWRSATMAPCCAITTAVRSFEVLGIGSREGVVEELLERRAIDARIELRARPLAGRPGHAHGLCG